MICIRLLQELFHFKLSWRNWNFNGLFSFNSSKKFIIIYSIIFFSFDLLYWTWFNVRTIQKRYLKLLPITNLLKWRWNYSGLGWFLFFNFYCSDEMFFVVPSFLLLMVVSGCKICLFNKLLVVHQWVVIERKIFSK